jgi:hypothetical protein
MKIAETAEVSVVRDAGFKYLILAFRVTITYHPKHDDLVVHGDDLLRGGSVVPGVAW